MLVRNHRLTKGGGNISFDGYKCIKNVVVCVLVYVVLVSKFNHIFLRNIKADEIYFSPSNLFWLTCFGMICQSILHRCPRIIVESTEPITPNTILEVIIQHKVNIVFISPSTTMGILKLLEESNGSITLDSMRLFASGGSFVSEELIQSMKKFLPNGKLCSCYGMTEVSGLISSSEVYYKTGSVGQLGPDIEVSVRMCIAM